MLAIKLHESQRQARMRPKRMQVHVRPVTRPHRLSPELSDEIRARLQEKGLGAEDGWYE